MMTIVICGDLSAKRPGDSEARGTILAVSRHRLRLAITEFVGAVFRPPRGPFLSCAALIELRQKSASSRADAFHVQNSLSNAPACHEQYDRRRLECPTKALKRLTR